MGLLTSLSSSPVLAWKTWKRLMPLPTGPQKDPLKRQEIGSHCCRERAKSQDDGIQKQVGGKQPPSSSVLFTASLLLVAQLQEHTGRATKSQAAENHIAPD